MEESRIKVAVRSRPLNKREVSKKSTSVVSCLESSSSVQVNCKPESKSFSFDHVYGASSTQESVFQTIGAPLTESCLDGFNGTIIAYGQTGSGKTHTLFGDADSHNDRGLVPRVFEFLWQKINNAELESDVSKAINYSCKCSFYEIYNEKVFDLLDSVSSSSSSGLHVREDQKKGVFVDGLSEEVVNSPQDANRVMSTGYRNRHVSSTAMNRDSSRSHAVFLLTMTSSTINDNGLKVSSSATFSLVDLAGSERQKSTQTEGLRLKEASKINQSLSTLGSVIHSLSNGNDNNKFVRYRDSTLTFLLRDSLGGNSKTVLIANISPSFDSLSETLGTLKFAQRAKTVRNSVTANTFTSGNIDALQREIATLRAQLAEGVPAAGSSGRRNSMVGGRRSIESCDSTLAGVPCPSPVYAVFSTLCDTSLLSSSLDRFKSIDEARMRAELKVHDLQNIQKQDETRYAALEEKLRLLQGGEKDEEAITRAEVSVVSERLQAEVLRYKSKAEELERRTSHTDVLNLWSHEKENEFREVVNKRVSEAERRCETLDHKFVALSQEKFESAVGISLCEAQSLRLRCEELSTRAGESEKKNAELQIALVKQQAMIGELEGSLGEGGGAVNHEVVSKALNDNAVLLKSFRDLEEKLGEKIAAVTEAETALTACQAQVKDLQAEVAHFKEAGDLQQKLEDTEELVRRLQSAETQKRRDIESLTFERDQATEAVDTLETQCASLLEEKNIALAGKDQDIATIEGLKAELAALLQSNSEEGKAKLMDAVNLSSQYVNEIARLQESLQKERSSQEAMAEENVTLKKEVELNRSVFSDMQVRLGGLREKDQKIAELSSTKECLLVELADNKQQNDEYVKTIADLKQDCEELQSRIVVLGKGAADKNNAPDDADTGFTSSAMVRKLRVELLAALEKVEENAKAHSNLLSVESELRAVKLLYEDSKQKMQDAELRANNMMEQLLGVDGDISRARDVNADYDKLKNNRDKMEKKLRKLEKERDAGRDVLAQVESDYEDLKSRQEESEAMLAEIRMENTALRESSSAKVRETKEIKRLNAELRKKDEANKRLEVQLESSRSIAIKAKADAQATNADNTVSKIVSRKRGLSRREGNNTLMGLANLPPPPSAEL